MSASQVDLFYIGAAVYLDLDSVEIDQILEARGLELTEDTIAECRAAVQAAELTRYEAGRDLDPDPDPDPAPRHQWKLPRG